MQDDHTEHLLTEIRDILASREKQYADFIASVDKRNTEAMNVWTARSRRWTMITWVGIFVTVYTAVYFATLHAR
jgi:hypothetical protein